MSERISALLEHELLYPKTIEYVSSLDSIVLDMVTKRVKAELEKANVFAMINRMQEQIDNQTKTISRLTEDLASQIRWRQELEDTIGLGHKEYRKGNI